MATKKELSDLALDASAREYAALKESKQIESEKLPNNIRIGRRDADTGMHEVIYPDDSQSINGNKIYSASNPDGMTVRAIQPNKNLPISLDSQSAKKQKPEVIVPEKKILPVSTGVGGLLAFSSNYMGIYGIDSLYPQYTDAHIVAALVAQRLGDADGWDIPTQAVTDKKILFHQGQNYSLAVNTNLILAFEKYGYSVVSQQNISPDALTDFNAVIARIVTFAYPIGQNYNYIVGDQLLGLKSLLERQGLVLLAGCGCAFGSQPINELLLALGIDWNLPQTSQNYDNKGTIDDNLPDPIPWTILETGNAKSIQYTPFTTYPTYFAGVNNKEILAVAGTGEVTIAYRSYPEVVTWM